MNTRKNLILLITLLLLGWLLATPVNRIGRFHDYVEAPQSGEKLTFREMNAFLQTWSAFLQKETAQKGIQQMSLSTLKPSQSLPKPLTRWLENEGWNPDRFFEVEARLRVIVKTALLQEHLEANRKLLQSSSDAAYNNLKRIIDEQARQINAEKVTAEELKLVRGNLYKIEAILDGKAVYEPE